MNMHKQCRTPNSNYVASNKIANIILKHFSAYCVGNVLSRTLKRTSLTATRIPPLKRTPRRSEDSGKEREREETVCEFST